ncbi:uncharacterized protein PHALS_09583 [Plasmopara halstedii]|uniref:Uncharacterized protein n=1 Tax=Plasmopara halstedii TaxID=4781 RepID=A0A0P1AE63_PLAHL|nr:uncharacterized protein PHALS_09583 [Plasmopara halstedii]CEG39329.1 hypothetical protein PHALS_09583 [Plasmopara halstedii]|eukprot:XP_024575698.1 hypothetical protein PHALS_09583 [Plasmopara halstedii]
MPFAGWSIERGNNGKVVTPRFGNVLRVHKDLINDCSIVHEHLDATASLEFGSTDLKANDLLNFTPAPKTTDDRMYFCTKTYGLVDDLVATLVEAQLRMQADVAIQLA